MSNFREKLHLPKGLSEKAAFVLGNIEQNLLYFSGSAEFKCLIAAISSFPQTVLDTKLRISLCFDFSLSNIFAQIITSDKKRYQILQSARRLNNSCAEVFTILYSTTVVHNSFL